MQTTTGLWNLTNSNAEFYFTGSINAESDGGNADASSKLTFTLTETVNYSITGIFQKYVSAGAISTSSFTTLVQNSDLRS